MKNYFDWRKTERSANWFKRHWAGAGHEIVKGRAHNQQAIFKSRSRTAKVSGSFIKAVGSFDGRGHCSRPSRILLRPFRNSPLKSGSFRWEANSWVRIQSGSGGDPVHQRKKDPSLWFRAFSMTTRSSPASRLQPSRAALEAFVRAAAIELPKGLAYQSGESHDAKRIRISICPVFSPA